MKKWTCLVLVVALALPVVAIAGSGEKCSSKDAQACLNHMSTTRDRGWTGFRYEANEKGDFVVKSVEQGSPAATAGVQVGDVVVAMNGVKLSDKVAVKKAKGEWKLGSQVTYTVMRNNAEQQVAVTLAPMPEEVFAFVVGQHMIEAHMAPASAVKAENPKK